MVEKTETPKKSVIFQHDPNDFNPNGLIKNVYYGTYNGKIIKWTDPVSGQAVFEWDEDFVLGPHYHVLINGAHTGDHRLPGEAVPTDLAIKYFGGM